MKTLVFFGSPRNNGQTKVLLNELIKELSGEVVVIDAYKTTVAPCKDCRYCWSKRGCSIKDEMQNIYKEIDEADNIVIATPLYFFTVPAPLKAIIDRLQIYWASRVRKDTHMTSQKKGAILMVGGAPSFENQFLAGEIVLKAVLRELNAECKGIITFANSDKKNVNEDEDVKERLKALAKTF